MGKRISVLVVDDSAFMRKVIADLLADDPEIQVIGTARDGLDAIAKIGELKPDVVTMDVEMPRLDGIATLQEIMKHHPLPVIMLSSLTQTGAQVTLKALELGAIDFIAKPSGPISLDIHKIGDELKRKVKVVAHVDIQEMLKKGRTGVTIPLQATIKAAQSSAHLPKVVALGTSTGGPRALQSVLPYLPKDIPAGILVVQHMPPGFTKSLAERLNSLSQIEVREARDGDTICAGTALIAPGDYHMEATHAANGTPIVRLHQEPPVGGHRPAVDVMMNSVVNEFGARIVGVLLTGMGSDGAKGIAKIKDAGGKTIAEDQTTCVVFGMPRVAIETGKVDRVVPLPGVASAIMELLV